MTAASRYNATTSACCNIPSSKLSVLLFFFMVGNEIPNSRQFSFGANWQAYLKDLSDTQIQIARKDIENWLGIGAIADKRVVDIGSGSGLHSMAFHRLGTRELLSFDVDEKSVTATRSLWKACGEPDNWTCEHGSILDDALIQKLRDPGFDVVYSWGVLHHTGAMWNAMGNAIDLIAPGGLFIVALYVKGPNYQRDLALKTKFNRASTLGKKVIFWRHIIRQSLKLLLYRQPREIKKLVFSRHYEHRRGMNNFIDTIDWLGGLPYEVASAAEVVAFTRKRNLVLERIETAFEGGNNIFLFSRPIDGVTGPAE